MVNIQIRHGVIFNIIRLKPLWKMFLKSLGHCIIVVFCDLGPVSRKSQNFSGVTIPYVSQEQRGFKSLNFTVIFLFVTLKTCEKISFPKQAVGSFTNGFSHLSKNVPLVFATFFCQIVDNMSLSQTDCLIPS